MQRSTHSHALARALIAGACALMLLAGALAQMAGADPGSGTAAERRAAIGANTFERSLLGGDRVRVQVLLGSAPGEVLPRRHRPALSGRTAGLTAARSAARRSPAAATATERSYAARLERRRNAALPAIRAAARPAVAIQERVQRAIEQLGGRIDPMNPAAGTILAVVPASSVSAIAKLEGVAAVRPGRRVIPMNSVVDGSPTWHAAGFTGQVPNRDLPAATDGPDVVVYDFGIRTQHVAFNTRKPSDCASCAGTGDSMDPAHPAAGPNTRVISPAGRTDFSGSEHGNTIAAAIGSTNFARGAGGTGLSYGIDKLYDVDGAQNPTRWSLGITYQGEPGVSDLPEVLNYSQGDYQDNVGFNPSWISIDKIVDEYGVTEAIAAGNCGVQDSFFTNCFDGPHRVVTPGNLFNVLTVGGMTSCAGNPSAFCVWPNSSSGPTYDGRKKPDLIATPYGNVSGPVLYDQNGNGNLYDDYGNTGIGTSFAAPQAAAGAALLASIGVYSPITQRAILINSAKPIQNQTYWTPTSGWGALDLATAFTQRAWRAEGQITGAGTNGARFYELSGVSIDDRATLAWNRRTVQVIDQPLAYRSLTNLDLSQISPLDSSGSTVTGAGGSDAADTVDKNTVDSNTDPGTNAPTDNPMPGSGDDGEDNVEQTRSTGSGTQILKVKAMSAVDGQASEPFSIAAAKPITALASPIPVVTLTPATTPLAVGASTTITATVVNPSGQLELTGAAVSLDTLPAGLEAVGATSASLGTIATGGSAATTFTVKGNAGGAYALRATASGTTYGEPFGGSGSAPVTFDSTPPAVTLTPLASWSTDAAPRADWSATDDLTGVASFDAEQQVAGGPWQRIVDGQLVTSALLGAGDGQTVAVRVRARDGVGNVSGWESTSTTIDATAPTISFGAAAYPSRGTVSVPVAVTNVGAPIVGARYSFTFAGIGPAGDLPPVVSFVNQFTRPVKAHLLVTASDAAGRSVTSTLVATVPSRYVAARVRMARPRIVRGGVIVRGTITKSARGRLRITAVRIGQRGDKRVSVKARARNGRFSARLRLARGTHLVRASWPRTGSVMAGSAARRIKIR